jgi:hypothetical protein
MGFEIGLAQPSVDRALADSTHEARLHAMDRTSCRSSGGKAGGTPGAWRVDQPVQSIAGEPLAPLPDPPRRPVHGAGDRPIAHPAPGEQHGPRSERHPRPGAASPTQML